MHAPELRFGCRKKNGSPEKQNAQRSWLTDSVNNGDLFAAWLQTGILVGWRAAFPVVLVTKQSSPPHEDPRQVLVKMFA